MDGRQRWPAWVSGFHGDSSCECSGSIRCLRAVLETQSVFKPNSLLLQSWLRKGWRNLHVHLKHQCLFSTYPPLHRFLTTCHNFPICSVSPNDSHPCGHCQLGFLGVGSHLLLRWASEGGRREKWGHVSHLPPTWAVAVFLSSHCCSQGTPDPQLQLSPVAGIHSGPPPIRFSG